MAYTNSTKNTATWRTVETETGLVWQDAVMRWSDATFTWASVASPTYTNQTKNTASFTNQTKN